MPRPLNVHVVKTPANHYAIISDRRWQQPYFQYWALFDNYRDARVHAQLLRATDGSTLFNACEWIERPYLKPRTKGNPNLPYLHNHIA